MRMNFLRPADPTGPVTYTVHTVHRGRSIVIYNVVSSGATGKPYTIATVTRTR
jgi:acyl-coenzyme A thioesterase PaaI-like protein